MDSEFDLIRPMIRKKYPMPFSALLKILLFQKLLNYLFPVEEHPALRNTIQQSRTRFEFQKSFMYRVIQSIVKKTSDELIFSGLEYS